MDDMDTGSNSASGSENRDLSEDEVAHSPPPMSDVVRNNYPGHRVPGGIDSGGCIKKHTSSN